MSKLELYVDRLNWFRAQERNARTRSEKQRFASIVAALTTIAEREAELASAARHSPERFPSRAVPSQSAL